MRLKTNTRVALLVAGLVVTIGLAPTASAGAVKPKLWCPQLAEPCYGSRDFPRTESLIVRPKIRPARTADARGNEAWRAGVWLMQ